MNKREFTQLFLEQANWDTSPESIKLHLRLWWVAPLSPMGLKLTEAGVEFLDSTLQIQKYTHAIKKDCPSNLKIISQMNRYLTSPFYIRGRKITFYGEKDAVMMAMMSGDLAQYLENFSR